MKNLIKIKEGINGMFQKNFKLPQVKNILHEKN